MGFYAIVSSFFRQRRSAVLHHQVEIRRYFRRRADVPARRPAAFCEGVLLLAALHLEKTDAGGDRADQRQEWRSVREECRWNADGII